jgi:hypothetical protein
MSEDRENDMLDEPIDPPDHRDDDEASLDSSGDDAKAIDPPDH